MNKHVVDALQDCERELSAVRLELQAVVRERDQYRDALERIAARGRNITLTADQAYTIARVALSRERKDDTVKPALTRWEAKQLDAMDAGERKDTNAER